LEVDFDTPIETIPGTKYSLSMYTLINKIGCGFAQDKISVQIQEGRNGVFKEIYLIEDRIHDDRWNHELITYIATVHMISVR
jgi:hypothetical protein